MKAIIIICSMLGAGCALQPIELARMNDKTVCRIADTGGPQTSANAKAEAQRRGQPCPPR